MEDEVLNSSNLIQWLAAEIVALDSLISTVDDPELVAIYTGQRNGYQNIIELWEE
jgi:hypothetical protein